MRQGSLKAARLPTMPRVAGMLLAALVICTVGASTARAAPPASLAQASPTLEAYIIRLARAMGLDGRLGPGATSADYIAFLFRQGLIGAEEARSLSAATGGPLTFEAFTRLASSVSRVLPAPSFLSGDYAASVRLAAHSAGLGYMRTVGERGEVRISQWCPWWWRICPGPPPPPPPTPPTRPPVPWIGMGP